MAFHDLSCISFPYLLFVHKIIIPRTCIKTNYLGIAKDANTEKLWSIIWLWCVPMGIPLRVHSPLTLVTKLQFILPLLCLWGNLVRILRVCCYSVQFGYVTGELEWNIFCVSDAMYKQSVQLRRKGDELALKFLLTSYASYWRIPQCWTGFSHIWICYAQENICSSQGSKNIMYKM